VCCSALQCVAECVVSDCVYKLDLFAALIGALQRVAACVAVRCGVLQCVAMCCRVCCLGLCLQTRSFFAVLIGASQQVLQCVAVRCNVLQSVLSRTVSTN